jgi:hypothetical protein
MKLNRLRKLSRQALSGNKRAIKTALKLGFTIHKKAQFCEVPIAEYKGVGIDFKMTPQRNEVLRKLFASQI